MKNDDSKKMLQQQNMKYLCCKLNQQLFINKVLFGLTVMLEFFLLFFGGSSVKHSSDSSDIIMLLIIYIVFAFPFFVSYITLSLTRIDLANCYRYTDVEDEECSEIEELITKAKDVKIGELAVLVIAFVLFTVT